MVKIYAHPPSFIRAVASTITAMALVFSSATVANAQKFDDVAFTGEKSKNFSDYEAVYVAPVKTDLNLKIRRVGRNTGNEDRPISDRDQTAKAEDLHDDLVSRIGRKFEIADAPGTGILTLQATITDLAASRPTKADYENQTGLSPNSVYAGGAEATFVISENSREIAVISDRFYGSFNDNFPRIGIWDDTDRTFARWSRNLTKFLSRN